MLQKCLSHLCGSEANPSISCDCTSELLTCDSHRYFYTTWRLPRSVNALTPLSNPDDRSCAVRSQNMATWHCKYAVVFSGTLRGVRDAFKWMPPAEWLQIMNTLRSTSCVANFLRPTIILRVCAEAVRCRRRCGTESSSSDRYILVSGTRSTNQQGMPQGPESARDLHHGDTIRPPRHEGQCIR